MSIRTETEEAGEDDGAEQQEETNGELAIFVNGSGVWVARGGVPDGVKRLSRHGGDQI